jgi:hypothetical protein
MTSKASTSRPKTPNTTRVLRSRTIEGVVEIEPGSPTVEVHPTVGFTMSDHGGAPSPPPLPVPPPNPPIDPMKAPRGLLIMVSNSVSSLFLTMLKWWLCILFLSQFHGVSHLYEVKNYFLLLVLFGIFLSRGDRTLGNRNYIIHQKRRMWRQFFLLCS